MSVDNKYKDGDVVWVKYYNTWWPAEVVATYRQPDDLQEEWKKTLKYCVVKFFMEETYEYIRTPKSISPFQCERKDEFIKKGEALVRANHKTMAKFPEAVAVAQKLTSNKNEKKDGEDKKDVITRRDGDDRKEKNSKNDMDLVIVNRPDSIVKLVLGQTSKCLDNNDGEIKSGDRRKSITRILDISAHIKDTNLSIINSSSTSGTISAYLTPSRSLVATPSSSGANVKSSPYNCNICGFTSMRQNVLIMHRKLHQGTGTGSGIILKTPVKSTTATDVMFSAAISKSRTSFAATNAHTNNYNGDDTAAIEITSAKQKPQLHTPVSTGNNSLHRRERSGRGSARGARGGLNSRGRARLRGKDRVKYLDNASPAYFLEKDRLSSTSATTSSTFANPVKGILQKKIQKVTSAVSVRASTSNIVHNRCTRANTGSLPQKEDVEAVSPPKRRRSSLVHTVVSDMAEITLPHVHTVVSPLTASPRVAPTAAETGQEKAETNANAYNKLTTAKVTPTCNKEELRRILADWSDEDKDDDMLSAAKVASAVKASDAAKVSSHITPHLPVDITQQVVDTQFAPLTLNITMPVSGAISNTTNRIRNIPKKDRRDVVLKEFNNDIVYQPATTCNNSPSSASTTPPIVSIDSTSSNSCSSDSVVVVGVLPATNAEPVIEPNGPIVEEKTESEVQPPCTTADTDSVAVVTRLITSTPKKTTTLSCFDFQDEEDEQDNDVLSSIAKFKKKYLSPDKQQSTAVENDEQQVKLDVNNKCSTHDQNATIDKQQKQVALFEKDQQLCAEIDFLLAQTTPAASSADNTNSALYTTGGKKEDVPVRGLPIKERGKRIFKSRNRSRVEEQPLPVSDNTSMQSTTKSPETAKSMISDDITHEIQTPNQNEVVSNENASSEIEKTETDIITIIDTGDEKHTNVTSKPKNEIDNDVNTEEEHELKVDAVQYTDTPMKSQCIDEKPMMENNNQEVDVKGIALTDVEPTLNTECPENHHQNTLEQSKAKADEESIATPVIKKITVDIFEGASMDIGGKDNNISNEVVEHSPLTCTKSLSISAQCIVAEDSLNGLKESVESNLPLANANEALSCDTTPTDENSSAGSSDVGAEFGSPTSLLDDERLPMLSNNVMTPIECLKEDTATPTPPTGTTLSASIISADDKETAATDTVNDISREEVSIVEIPPVKEIPSKEGKQMQSDTVTSQELATESVSQTELTDIVNDASESIRIATESTNIKNVPENQLEFDDELEEDEDEIESPPHEELSGNELEHEFRHVKKNKTLNLKQNDINQDLKPTSTMFDNMNKSNYQINTVANIDEDSGKPKRTLSKSETENATIKSRPKSSTTMLNNLDEQHVLGKSTSVPEENEMVEIEERIEMVKPGIATSSSTESSLSDGVAELAADNANSMRRRRMKITPRRQPNIITNSKDTMEPHTKIERLSVEHAPTIVTAVKMDATGAAYGKILEKMYEAEKNPKLTSPRTERLKVDTSKHIAKQMAIDFALDSDDNLNVAATSSTSIMNSAAINTTASRQSNNNNNNNSNCSRKERKSPDTSTNLLSSGINASNGERKEADALRIIPSGKVSPKLEKVRIDVDVAHPLSTQIATILGASNNHAPLSKRPETPLKSTKLTSKQKRSSSEDISLLISEVQGKCGTKASTETDVVAQLQYKCPQMKITRKEVFESPTTIGVSKIASRTNMIAEPSHAIYTKTITALETNAEATPTDTSAISALNELLEQKHDSAITAVSTTTQKLENTQPVQKSLQQLPKQRTRKSSPISSLQCIKAERSAGQQQQVFTTHQQQLKEQQDLFRLPKQQQHEQLQKQQSNVEKLKDTNAPITQPQDVKCTRIPDVADVSVSNVSAQTSPPRQHKSPITKPKSPAAAATGGRKHAGNTIMLPSTNIGELTQDKSNNDQQQSQTPSHSQTANSRRVLPSNKRKSSGATDEDGQAAAKSSKINVSSSSDDVNAIAKQQLLQLQQDLPKTATISAAKSTEQQTLLLHKRKSKISTLQHRKLHSARVLTSNTPQDDEAPTTSAAALAALALAAPDNITESVVGEPMTPASTVTAQVQQVAAHSTTSGSDEQQSPTQSATLQATGSILAVPTHPIPGYNETFLLCMVENNTYRPIDNIPLYLDHDLNQLVPIPVEAVHGDVRLVITTHVEGGENGAQGQQVTSNAVRTVEHDYSTSQLLSVQSVDEMDENGAEISTNAVLPLGEEISTDGTDTGDSSGNSAGLIVQRSDDSNAFLLNIGGQHLIIDETSLNSMMANPELMNLVTEDGVEYVLPRNFIQGLIAQQRTWADQVLPGETGIENAGTATDILAVAVAGSDLYGNEMLEIETGQGLQLMSTDGTILYQPGVVPPAQTNETNALLNQTPIMSPLEQPTNARTKRSGPIGGIASAASVLLEDSLACGSPEGRPSLDDSLAVIGVTSSSTVPTSLELPITVTNPAIASKANPPTDIVQYQVHRSVTGLSSDKARLYKDIGS